VKLREDLLSVSKILKKSLQSKERVKYMDFGFQSCDADGNTILEESIFLLFRPSPAGN
jgi:hypothetical protein